MFEPGTQIGRYEVQRKIGRGGMGTVYVAHDPVLGRMVAIKIFAGDLDMPDARARFTREARAAAALSHSNIVTVYDFGEYESQPYIVMEYVPGDTLANFIRRKVPVSLVEKLRWMEELCAGAGYAHQMSLIHRDIKPANLIVDRSARLKILDFGIARMLAIKSNTSVMIGTPGYMAPEQITGDPVDHRADQFSIGVVFYELLAYTEPFPGDTLPMITHRILNQEPAPLEQLVPDVNPELVQIVTRALKKKSADRFRDADAMRVAISRVRRHYESDVEWNTPTMPIRPDSSLGSGNRGTGSARRSTNDSVGVAELTPPPDPRRTDREALARRRTTQVDAALVQARVLFAQKRLEDALEACQQALVLDETHAVAIELEQEIQTALRIREGVEIAADDLALTAAPEASSPSTEASRLLESQAITRFHEDAFAVTGLPPASSERPLTNSAPPVAPTDAPPAPAAVPTATAVAAPSVPVPAPTCEDVAAPVQQVVAAAFKDVGPIVQEAVQVARGGGESATSSRQRQRYLVGVGTLALAAAAAFVLMRGAGATGTAFIEAAPWGTVTAIRGESGDEWPLPAPATTPLSVALPAGTYEITLTGPPPESRAERVRVRIDAGATSVVPVTRFESLTIEQYFEEYLSAPGAGAAP